MRSTTLLPATLLLMLVLLLLALITSELPGTYGFLTVFSSLFFFNIKKRSRWFLTGQRLLLVVSNYKMLGSFVVLQVLLSVVMIWPIGLNLHLPTWPWAITLILPPT